MAENIEQITIKERSDLIVSKKSQKTYFTIDDLDGRRLLCFVPSLYNELPDGATVLVNIRPGRTEADTPSITGMATEDEMRSTDEIPRQIGKPEVTREQSIETQVAIKEIGEDWRVGKRGDDDPLVMARDAWLSMKFLRQLIPNAYKEAKDELNRQPDGKDEQPDRPDSETSGFLPLEETREQRGRIRQLAKDAGYTKLLWESMLPARYGKRDLTKFSQEELNKLEEQLKLEAK